MHTEPRTPRSRRAASIDGPDPIDVHVGQRMRLRRTMLGTSQARMSEAIGISFQQCQKYEHGTNRISASRLFDVSRFLNVPVSYFFEGLTEDAVAARDEEVKVPLAKAADPIPGVEDDPMARTETLELARAYWRLPSDTLRDRFLRLLESVPGSDRSTAAPLPQAAE